MVREDKTRISKFLKVEPECVNKLNQLNPALVSTALDIYYRARQACIPMHIMWTRRTEEEQRILYQFGRTIPPMGIITTRKPGFSPHNYGLAIDFCFKKKDKLITYEQAYKRRMYKEWWMAIVKEFMNAGWNAGMYDREFQPGHVENLLGKSIVEHRNAAQSKKTYIEGFGFV